MLNPEIWRQEEVYFRKVGLDKLPSFSRTLAHFYQNHSTGLWTTTILLFGGRMVSLYFGQSEIATVCGLLFPGPVLSTMTGALLHASQGLDNTRR